MQAVPGCRDCRGGPGKARAAGREGVTSSGLGCASSDHTLITVSPRASEAGGGTGEAGTMGKDAGAEGTAGKDGTEVGAEADGTKALAAPAGDGTAGGASAAGDGTAGGAPSAGDGTVGGAAAGDGTVGWASVGDGTVAGASVEVDGTAAGAKATSCGNCNIY